MIWNDLLDMMGSQNGHPYIKNHSGRLEHTDKDVNSVDTHISIFYDGSAVAAVSIAMTILHENEGKNG